MKQLKSTALFVLALASTFAPRAAAQTTFSHDNAIAITAVGGGEDLLTEGAAGPPVVAIGGASLGLVPGDHIDALSMGDDVPLMIGHRIVFSVDPYSPGLGVPGNGVFFEFVFDSAPCAGAAPVPMSACGDIFIQTLAGGSNMLAPLGAGYSPGGAAAGDECHAGWAGGNVPSAADDLNAFDYTAPANATGIYFSLAPGSPTLAAIAATAGDILYSDLSGAAPVIATLGGGAGPATATNLGIQGWGLDALSLVGTGGPVGAGGGVIAAGAVGPAPASTGVVSTHLLEFSVARGGFAFVGFAGEVLVRSGAGVAAVFVPAEAGLGLAIVNEDELNALEVIPAFFSQIYCTAGTSASGCQASISAAGLASATASSGFFLMASGVEGAKDGIFFSGTNGRQAAPWGNGSSFRCVVPPVKRAGLMLGVGTNGACDGTFSKDLNARWCPTCPKAAQNPGAGTLVQAQLWYRDPFSTDNKTSAFSDAVEFCVSP